MNETNISARRWMMREARHVALEDWDFDNTPLAPREILVRAEWTAVSPGTECANFLALDPDVYRASGWCKYPWMPGYAGVGHVLAKGDDVGEYQLGDRVVGLLPHATHFRLSADWLVIPAAENIESQHLAYTRIISIAMNALEVLRADPLATAGVWGLGGVGNLIAQLLRASGFHVVGIDPVAERRALAEKCGIETTLDPGAKDFSDALKFLAPDDLGVVVDTTGQANVTMSLPQHLSLNGQMVLMTHWRSQPPVDATEFMSHIFRKGATLQGALDGSIGGGLTGSDAGTDWAARQRVKFRRIGQALAQGQINVAPLISHTVVPQQCREVYEGLCFDREHWWGVVVDWRDKED